MEKLQIKSRADFHLLLPKDFVSFELGVAEGLFSRDILSWGGKMHYMIDSWKKLNQKGDGSREQAWHNVNYTNAYQITQPFSDRRTIIKAITSIAATELENESIDFGYVDAWHTFEGVKSDIQHYWPKIKPGGIMGFHDYLNRREYGVYDAVNEFASNNGFEINVIPENDESDAGAWIRKPLKK